MSFFQSMPQYCIRAYGMQRFRTSPAADNYRQSDALKYHNCGMQTLSERLKEARDEKGWTQDQLAKEAKIPGKKPQSIIGGLESGHRGTTSHLPKIAHALGVNALWLAEGKGPKYTNERPHEPETQIDASIFDLCFSAVGAWLAKDPDKRLLTTSQQIHMAINIYNTFHNQPDDATEEKMLLFIEGWVAFQRSINKP